MLSFAVLWPYFPKVHLRVAKTGWKSSCDNGIHLIVRTRRGNVFVSHRSALPAPTWRVHSDGEYIQYIWRVHSDEPPSSLKKTQCNIFHGLFASTWEHSSSDLYEHFESHNSTDCWGSVLSTLLSGSTSLLETDHSHHNIHHFNGKLKQDGKRDLYEVLYTLRSVYLFHRGTFSLKTKLTCATHQTTFIEKLSFLSKCDKLTQKNIYLYIHWSTPQQNNSFNESKGKCTDIERSLSAATKNLRKRYVTAKSAAF